MASLIATLMRKIEIVLGWFFDLNTLISENLALSLSCQKGGPGGLLV